MDERQRLEQAGFSDEQIEALMDAFTVHHHHHDMDEVDGLEEELSELGLGEDSDDDDD